MSLWTPGGEHPVDRPATADRGAARGRRRTAGPPATSPVGRSTT